MEVGTQGALWAGLGSLGAAACRCPVDLTTADCPAPAGRMGQAGIRAAHSCHVLSRGGHGLKRPRGPGTRGLQQLLNVPVPCLPDSCGAECSWHRGTSESAASETQRPPGSTPRPIISALPHGVQTRAQRQPPWTTRPPPPRRAPPPGSGARGPSRRSTSRGPSRRIAHGAILAADESVHRPTLGSVISFLFWGGRGLILKVAEFRNTFTRILFCISL